MKKAIIIISVVLILAIACAFVANPIIQKHKIQTIISDCEYTIGIVLPDDIKIMEGSSSQCYPKKNKINSVVIMSEITKEQYEFIKNQVAGKEEWSFPTDKNTIETRLKYYGWQNEEYESFRKIEYSKEVVTWYNQKLIFTYKKSNGKYFIRISASTDFYEYRNIEI